MPYSPAIHHRRSIRLKGYDYSQAGLYFVTICVQNRRCLFGKIENGEMILNDLGKIIENEWLNLKNKYPQIELDTFIIMPNHFHAILQIVRPDNAILQIARTDNAVSQIVGAGFARPDNIRPNNTHLDNTVSQIAHPDNTNPTDNAILQIVRPDNAILQIARTDNAVSQIAHPDNVIQKQGRANPAPTNTTTLGNIIGYFKYQTTKKIDSTDKLWQRNYYEHIIRNEQAYQNIADYIMHNPAAWQKDKFYAE